MNGPSTTYRIPPTFSASVPAIQTISRFLALFLCLLPAAFANAQTDVLTQHNDNARTGQNLTETILTPASVASGKFGKLFSYPVDSHVFAQPLVASGLSLGGKTRNVLYVVTEHNSVYAFDADDSTSPTLWQVNLGTSVPVPNAYFGARYGPYHDVPLEIGITGTPVIDKTGKTLYVVAFTQDGLGGPYHMKLYALDLLTGAAKLGSPINITGTVKGTGGGSVGGNLAFDPEQHLQRPGLALANGTLYIAFGSHADTDPYHGWVFAYNATTLAQQGIHCTTPNSNEAGIWMSGAGVAVDSAGAVYFETGNGDFTASAGGKDYGEAFVKLGLSGSGLTVSDYFTPFNVNNLNNGDTDLGSGGLTLLPDQIGTTPHLLVGAGKEGKIYLVNRDAGKMGGYNSAFDSVPQSFGGAIGGTWSKPAYFNGAVYYAGNGDFLKMLPLYASAGMPARLATSAASRSPETYDYPGATPIISANGTQNGIVWAIQGSNVATLRAYDAANVSYELYNSAAAPGLRDYAGAYDKFTVPTVANGKVYVPAQFQVSVFGIGNFLDTPVISPNSGSFAVSQTVSISVTTPGAVIHYTTDGTTPTGASPAYTAPFTLTSSATVQAIATKAGYANSIIASAGFLQGDGPGDGNGLQGAYYSNTGLSGSPVITQTDPTVNFLWNGGTPAAGVSGSNFSARWTGQILPRSTGTYTFYATSDDGVRLYVNGKNLINAWVNQGATEYGGSIALTRGTPVSITLEYFQGTGGSQLSLSYSTLGLSKQIIPQTQLYTNGSLTVQTPVIAPFSGSFYPSATVTISDATTGADIHYTTDGTDPTVSSALYTGPINIRFTTTVKAMAAKANRISSGIASTVLTYNPNLAAPHLAVNSGGPDELPFIADESPDVTTFAFSGGAGHTRIGDVDTSLVPNSAPASVYQSERLAADLGTFSYVFSSLSPVTTYTIRLHFAENTATAAGQRVMNILINNKTVLSNFDIYAVTGGSLKGIVKEFQAKPSAAGLIFVGFATVAGAAKSSGIEILPTPKTATVSGTVLLDSLSGQAAPQTVQFQFRPTDGSLPFTLTAPISGTGAFSFSGIPVNTYTLAMKGAKWMQKVVPLDLTAAVTPVSVTLRGGDANNDNRVDILDFGALVNSYGSLQSDPTSGYDPQADFNCDGMVDVLDFGILINNYGTVGDN